MIQYALEAYLSAGIDEFCIITSPDKPKLKDFITGNWTPSKLPFEKDDRFYERLRQCRVTFITQDHPVGVADAVGRAKGFVGDQPFACIMPDCLLFSERSHLQQLLPVFEKHEKNVIGTVLINGTDINRFGNVGVLQTQEFNSHCFLITSLSGKRSEPLNTKPGEVLHKGFGGGIYLPEYFELIERTRPHAKGEVDDVPIHQILIDRGALLGVLLQGAAFDTGHPLGFRAAVHYAGRKQGSAPKGS